MEKNLQLPVSFDQLLFLARQLPKTEKKKLIKILQKEEQSKSGQDSVFLQFASETSLSKDWLKPEEDEAWKNL